MQPFFSFRHNLFKFNSRFFLSTDAKLTFLKTSRIYVSASINLNGIKTQLKPQLILFMLIVFVVLKIIYHRICSSLFTLDNNCFNINGILVVWELFGTLLKDCSYHSTLLNIYKYIYQVTKKQCILLRIYFHRDSELLTAN